MVESVLQKLRSKRVSATLVRGASTAFVIRVVSTGILFGVQSLLARLLGAANYGDYVYALSWLNLLALLGKLGTHVSALRFVPAYQGSSEWGLLRGFLSRSQQSALAASIGLAVVAAGVIWLIHTSLSPQLTKVLWIACFLLPLKVLIELRSAILLALKRVFLARCPQLIFHPVLLGSGVLLAIIVFKKSANASTAITIDLIVTSTALILTEWFLRRILLPTLETARTQYRTKEWSETSLRMLLMSGMQLLLNQTDIIMIGFFLGTTAAGIYAAASRIVRLVLFGLESVNSIVAPLISQLYAQDRLQELQRVITLSAWGIFTFTLPASLGMILFGKSVLLLFGQEFVVGYPALVILLIGHVVSALSGSAGFLMTMTKYEGQVARVISSSAIINILLNALLIPVWGIQGAAMATATTIAFRSVVLVYCAQKNLGLKATVV
jgi:O-antigen/teichoic acid export membrane protein